MSNTNKPISKIRDGSHKATIWKNQGETGAFYSVTFSRTYKDAQGNLRDADSFSGSGLLKIARLVVMAYDEIAEIRALDKQAEEAA